MFGLWGEFGFCLILFLAGVMKIPASLYEAARVDGANAIHEFFAVTLPGLRYELQVVLVLSVIGTLGTFDEIYVMTGGGPGTATIRPRLPRVAPACSRPSQVGSAAALGIVLMLIVFAVTCGLNRLMERGAERADHHVAHAGDAELRVDRRSARWSPIYPLVGVVPREPVSHRAGSRPVGVRAAPDVRSGTTTSTRGTRAGSAPSFTTSIIVAAVMVPASVLLSVLAGYAFATMRFWGSKVLFYLFILGLIIPTEATIVPLYYDMRAMGLLDTYWALILLETSGEVAFGIFWMRAAFLSAPQSLLEAARIDGASSWKTLWRIMVPFAKPAILTLTVLTFADSWNEFFLALVFTINHMTAPAGLASFSGRYTTESRSCRRAR